MTPPLRDHKCQHALWRGLQFDDLQIVATDHCPFCINENPLGILKSKRYGEDNFNKIPNGAPGVELRLELLYDGGVREGKNKRESLCAAHRNRALPKCLECFLEKAPLPSAANADIVLFDPNKRHTLSASTHHSNVDYSLFEGRSVQGKVEKKSFCEENSLSMGKNGWADQEWGSILSRSASGRVL